jgi:hypothetical protein
MSTTAVIPTFVVSSALTAHALLPTFVCSGTAIAAGGDLPAYVCGATRTSAALPPYRAAQYVHFFGASGGCAIAGAADVVGDPFTPTGGMSLAGAATLTFPFNPTGGATVAGSAGVVFKPILVYDIGATDAEPQGGAQIAGAATVSDNIPVRPTGGSVVSGAAAVLERITWVPTGGSVVSGAAPIVVVGPITPTGGSVIASSAPVAFVSREIGAGGCTIAGAATVRDYQAWYAPSGGANVGGLAIAYALLNGQAPTTENPYNDEFNGWAINYETNAPSRYERMPANSFCQFMGTTYLANAGGIYSYGADDDAGQPIHAAALIPETDYGSENNKRIPDVHIGIRMNGKMRLRVAANKTRRYYTIERPDDPAVRALRVKLGMGLEGRYWAIGLENVDGADFELESLAHTPMILTRHGK